MSLVEFKSETSIQTTLKNDIIELIPIINDDNDTSDIWSFFLKVKYIDPTTTPYQVVCKACLTPYITHRNLKMVI